MERILKLYKGVAEFPNKEEQVILKDFKYNSQRMAACPTISASFMHHRCLDNEWSEEVYAEFNGEKYYIKAVPTSSKDNKTLMYKHDLTLYSERFILDNTFFYNAVKAENGTDLVASTTNVTTMCKLDEFVRRINDSLEYSKLGYKVDASKLTKEELEKADQPKQISLDKAFIGTALQEIYNQWEIPYYFNGKTIFLGSGELVNEVFEYGADNSLLSVKKNNQNYKIITRCSGFGGTENIPHYYPNWSAKGIIDAFALPTNKVIDKKSINIVDMEKYDKYVPLNGVVAYKDADNRQPTWGIKKGFETKEFPSGFNNNPDYSKKLVVGLNSPKGYGYINAKFHVRFIETFTLGVVGKKFSKMKWDEDQDKTYKHIISNLDFNDSITASSGASSTNDSSGQIATTATIDNLQEKFSIEVSAENQRGYFVERNFDVTLTFLTTEDKPFATNSINDYWLSIVSHMTLNGDIKRGDVAIGQYKERIGDATFVDRDYYASLPSNYIPIYVLSDFSIQYATAQNEGWYINDRKFVENLSNIGIQLNIKQGANLVGEGFKQEKVGWITPSKTLMPSIYRDSLATEIFYNAKNNTYTDEQGNAYVFENEWVLSNQREHIQDFSDIHPTIKGMLNANNQPIDQILDVAFDDNDSNEVDEEGNYLHPYFYVRIAQTNGTKSFNIFNQKLVGEPMKMSFTKGDVAAATFEIQVDTIKNNTNEEYETVINPIQVDDNGNIVKGDWQDKIKEGEPIESQQDSSLGSIWLILKKDNATFNETMPNYPTIVPKANDTFVLLNIKMPRAYVLDAEKKLDAAIIRYMYENNSDKFNFAIDFSRIYLQENPLVTKQLNENCKVKVQYNGAIYELFVNNFTYEVKAKEVLPKISIGLADIITINRSVTQTISDGIMKNVMDIAAPLNINDLNRKYLRKDGDDSTPYNLNVGNKLSVQKGIESNGSVSTPRVASPKFTNDTLGSGFEIKEDKEGISTLTIDNVIVRRKLQATEFIIQQIQFQGGIVFQTAAGMECNKVEDNTTFYRCYFDTKDGAVSNQFVVNDLARCQRMGYSPKYYWRKVVAIGADYIDLSVQDCDTGSDIPSVGDIIVQLGHTTDVSRQSAIEMNTIGEQAPSFKMYSGINSYSLYLKDVTGIVFDKQEKKPSLYSYGDMFFGDRDKGTYIQYDASKHKMNIKAQVTFESSNNDYRELDSYLNDMNNNITNANTNAQNAQSSIDNLEIGGTNLMLNTDFSKGIKKNFIAFDCIMSVDNQFRLETKSSGSSNRFHITNIDLNPNIPYIFKFYYWADNQKPEQFNLRAIKEGEDKWLLQPSNIATSDDGAKILTYKYTAPKKFNGYIQIENKQIKTPTYFKYFKLEQGTKATDWSPSPEDVKQDIANTEDKLTENLATEVTKINEDITKLQDQIDGKVDSWFLNGVPTTNNKPAVDWTTDSLKKEHEGDTYTNTATSGEEIGKSWRWYKGEQGWNWYVIQDTDAIKALKAAQNAQSTADGKATIFTTNDTTLIKNYHIGDMWILPQDKTINSENYLKGDILTANQESETYVASHWSKEVRYTDDSAAEIAQSKADQAQIDANKAQSKADQAQTDATNAKNRLDDWAKDSVISPNEKQSLKDEMARILADKNQINDDYTKYNIGVPTAFNTAYTNYNNELIKLSNKEPENIPIDANFATYQTNFYTQRTNALNAISKASQQYAENKANDAAALAVNNLQIGGTNLILNTDFSKGIKSNYINRYDALPLKVDAKYRLVVNPDINLKKTRLDIQKIDIKENQKYILSFLYWGWDKNKIDEIYIRESQKVIIPKLIYNEIENGEFESPRRLVYSIEGNVEITNGYIQLEKTNTTNEYRIKDIKLEQGNKRTDWTPSPKDIDSEIEQAKKDATKAKEDLAAINGDERVTKQERNSLLQQKKDIESEYNEIIEDANKYKVSHILFDNAKSLAIDALVKYTNFKAEQLFIPIESDYNNISAYYDARTNIIELIGNATKSYNENLVNNINIGGVNLLPNSRNCFDLKCYSIDKDYPITILNDKESNQKVITAQNGGKQYKAELHIPINNFINKNNPFSLSFMAIEKNWGTDISISPVNIYKDKECSIKLNNVLLLKKQDKRVEFIGYTKEIVKEIVLNIGSSKTNESGNGFGFRLGIYKMKVEEGNKITTWSPSPEDVDNDIKEAQQTADNATESFNSLNSTLFDAFKDGTITESEKSAINEQKNSLIISFDNLTKEYVDVRDSEYLVDKTQLNTKYNALKKSYNDLISYIDNILKFVTDYKTNNRNQFISILNQYNNSNIDYKEKLDEYKSQVVLDGNNIQKKLKETTDAFAKETSNARVIANKNYIAKKFLVDWNNIKEGICNYGTDNDGEYFSINNSYLYKLIGKETTKDIWGGKIKYKINTQYTFKIKGKVIPFEDKKSSFSFYIKYTDGTYDEIWLNNDFVNLNTKTITTEVNKTISIITCRLNNSEPESRIYDIQLTEGTYKNNEWLKAEEDTIEAINNRLSNTFINVLKSKKAQYFYPTTDIKPSTEYTFSIDKFDIKSGTDCYIEMYLLNRNNWSDYYKYIKIPVDEGGRYYTFRTPSNLKNDELLCIALVASCDCTIYKMKFAEGNVYTGWSAASPEEYESLRLLNDAIKGQTDVVGGLVMTNMIQMKNTDGKVTAGISGILNSGSYVNEKGETIYNGSDSIHFWGGSDLANIQKAPFRVYNNGECYATRFYGFEPAFEINNSNKNKFITNNTIDVDKLGGKVLLNLTNSQLSGSLSFPIGEKYIGSEIEIYNPNMLPFNICSDSLVSPRYATLDNAFDYINTSNLSDYMYYHKVIQEGGTLHPTDKVLRWSIKYSLACVTEKVSPEYSIWKCVKFIPKAANVDGYFELKGNTNLYYTNYGTTENPIYILWILKEQRGTGKFKFKL